MTIGTVRWLGHSAFELTLPDGRVILIDPWLNDNPSCPDDCKNPARCDFVVLTHGHVDHIGDADRLIDAFNPKIIGAVELCDALGRNRPKGQYFAMNIGGTQTIDGIDFTLTFARHSSSVNTESGPVYTGMPCGVVIRFGDLAGVYHAGDTDVFGDMKLIAELFQPKVAILPIGDHFTMGPKGAALAARFLEPNTIVPMHYGTFPLLRGAPDALRTALDPDLKDRLVVPKAGERWNWTAQGLVSA
jgi:L-ascorbate metabolism protein UlaG (beta-lactamase superfamily)